MKPALLGRRAADRIPVTVGLASMELALCLALCVSLFLTSAASSQVTFQRLRNSAAEPGSWLTYSGSYSSQRFSSLREITPDNVGRLRATWVYQIQSPGLVETTPLVADGMMILTEPPNNVTALDLKTGRSLWSWRHPLPEDVRTLGFPPVNRGVAWLGDTVYVGTLDAYLFALDAHSGAVRWQTQVADNKTGHSITAAPLAIDGKVIVGISGGEAGIRGFLDAYDAATGKLLWRFWTIPGPGEPGNETWKGDSWKTGAGATWITGSYDPEIDTLYWGIGNPGPDWNGDVRPGDNLYTSSVVALDATSGKLRWHFQFTPHDTHDWDANQVPLLVDATVDDRPRKLLATPNRNGFYYLLDRANGQFLTGVPYIRQTWARGLDESGRPIVIPGTEPSVEGTLVYPSLQGATNWYSPSYSPETGMVYVAAREMGAVYFKGEADYEPGEYFMAGGEQARSGDDAYGAIRALDLRTGEKKWELWLRTPPWSGVMSTAGGLVFGGDQEGNFFALDAATGKTLWRFQTGGPLRSNPIAFEIDGHQHVATAAGGALFVFGLER